MYLLTEVKKYHKLALCVYQLTKVRGIMSGCTESYGGFTHRQESKIDWQWPLSGVHTIMMVNSAQPDEGGGCTPSPFHFIYNHEQSCGVGSS